MRGVCGRGTCHGVMREKQVKTNGDMPSSDTIDVRALLDSRPVGRWQKWMILLCFLVVVMDGFDVVIMVAG